MYDEEDEPGKPLEEGKLLEPLVCDEAGGVGNGYVASPVHQPLPDKAALVLFHTYRYATVNP